METTMLLSAKNLEDIKDIIQDELLKRGFTAPINFIKEVVKSENHHIEFQTEEFQTTPIIFKTVQIGNFSTSVEKEVKDNGEEYVSVWISVDCFWKTFSGGTNGTSLFDIFFSVYNENNVILTKIR